MLKAIRLWKGLKVGITKTFSCITVSLEIFARILFLQIFANLLPHEFKVLANKEPLKAIKTTQTLIHEFENSQIIRKLEICEIKVMRKFRNLQYIVFLSFENEILQLNF